MRWLLAVILAAVELGGAFGTASATLESREGDAIIVVIEVEVKVSAEAVVAHLAFEEERSLVLPLVDRGDGVYGIRTRLEAKNYQVVFEVVGGEGGISAPVSLTRLGVDLTAPGETTTTTIGDDPGARAEPWGWLALALAAASLSALAFWALGGREPAAAEAEEE